MGADGEQGDAVLAFWGEYVCHDSPLTQKPLIVTDEGFLNWLRIETFMFLADLAVTYSPKS
jgi:hypothetical protein